MILEEDKVVPTYIPFVVFHKPHGHADLEFVILNDIFIQSVGQKDLPIRQFRLLRRSENANKTYTHRKRISDTYVILKNEHYNGKCQDFRLKDLVVIVISSLWYCSHNRS